MEEIINKIFNRYINEDSFTEEILADPEYIKLSKHIDELDKELLNHGLDIEFCNEIMETYMNLCNEYRKYDFSNALVFGIITGNELSKNDNKEFISECYSLALGR